MGCSTIILSTVIRTPSAFIKFYKSEVSRVQAAGIQSNRPHVEDKTTIQLFDLVYEGGSGKPGQSSREFPCERRPGHVMGEMQLGFSDYEKPSCLAL